MRTVDVAHCCPSQLQVQALMMEGHEVDLWYQVKESQYSTLHMFPTEVAK